MSISFNTDLSSLKNLQENFKKFGDKLIDNFLDDVADAILFEAKKLLREGKIEGSNDPHGGGAFDRGDLYKSGIVRETDRKEREIAFTAPHALFVEYGTAPHMPPVKPLQQWAKRNKISNWKEVGWAVARKIEKQGLPPRPFLKQAVDNVSLRLDEIYANVVRRIS